MNCLLAVSARQALSVEGEEKLIVKSAKHITKSSLMAPRARSFPQSNFNFSPSALIEQLLRVEKRVKRYSITMLSA
jgi:hypothetical protein